MRTGPSAAPPRKRTALVTGASSGIGAAVAERLAAEHWRLLLNGRDEDRLNTVAAATGGTALPRDLATPDGPARLAQDAIKIGGRIDLLVAGAGVGWVGPFADMPGTQVDRLMGVNVVALMRLVHGVLPHMLGAGGGTIVLIGSVAGIGVRNEAVYSASKAAVHAFAEALRYEVADSGVHMAHVVPGVVDTPFLDRRQIPYTRSRPRPMPPGRVADVVWEACRHGRDEVFVPSWMRLPGCVRTVAPELYHRLVRRFG
ncbi:MAG TPA: SDR family NAD(P)-dependent oxidoreductase [Yinghuangia sp.]|nr:SDR family NAD(P)-dependent oxidoreductase [Yinghuangia sp.]